MLWTEVRAFSYWSRSASPAPRAPFLMLSTALSNFLPTLASLGAGCRAAHVEDPRGLVADLALDDQGAGVADPLQRGDELADVDLALAQGDLLAPLPGDFRPPGVLDVDAADVGPEDLDGPDRVAHVVEEHV